MAKYKPYSYAQGQLIPVMFSRQIQPGTFEFTLNHLIDHECPDYFYYFLVTPSPDCASSSVVIKRELVLCPLWPKSSQHQL